MRHKDHRYAVILAGGEGNRFWPLSRSLNPKQFLSLYNTRSIFEDTLARVKAVICPDNIFIVTNQLYFPEIFNYTSGFKIPPANIIFEPAGKNTAPSIAIASRLINLIDSQAVMIVLPSDHRIENKEQFHKLMRYAFSSEELLGRGLVTFGIPAEYPSTGFGYIKIKSECFPQNRLRQDAIKRKLSEPVAFCVERFIEKPDLKTAKKIFADKTYFWNSGMFLGSTGFFLEEIKKQLPRLFKTVSQVRRSAEINDVWRDIEPISFDYGVLQKTANISMIPAANLGWSDLGTWASLDSILPKDKHANTVKADAIILESKNITVFGKNRLIACLGVENLIVVDTPDALLILRKDKSEDVKNIVQVLKQNNRQEYYLHKTVKRPWGKYTVLESGLGFKVKLIEVLPGKALSLQKHQRRSEHWVVVEGLAKITNGKKEYFVKQNESTFIPKHCLHRLENPADNLLKIIEVQSGDYLEEDDIIRIKDDFKRK